ncbi:MAG: hypothetical protein H6708_04740 [Kofleriaceae bacterium]|nr:hypothetical protein [Kofleriaceae bacterium]
MWGTDSAGHNNTPMDAASNAGHWVDETFGDGSPSFLGGAVTAGLSAPAALLGLTGVADPWVGAAKAEYGLAKAGASWVGGLFD